MKIDPFTGELYQGSIETASCDGCGDTTEYEADAYGQDFLVLCPKCCKGGLHVQTEEASNVSQAAEKRP